MKTTKSIKFHTEENLDKTFKVKDFLIQCNEIGNKLIELHFGCFIENNKFEFINNTKDYNSIFKIRSHHLQQIQEKVFNIIWLRYNKTIEQTKFDCPELNYLKYFVSNWSNIDDFLIDKIKKTKNNQFYQHVLNYWIENKKQVKELITKTILNKIRNSNIPKIKKLVMKVDNRTTLFEQSKQTSKFNYWINLILNTKVGKRYQNIYLPIKWSEYHEEKLNGLKLNNSFLIKWDEVYDRLEIIGTYSKSIIDLKVSNPNQNNTLGVDIGVNNLVTFSNGYQLNTQALQKEFEKFLVYEKQVKRLQAKGLYNSKKYIRKQIQLSNKVENKINQTLNNIPKEIEHVVFEDLNFKDKISKKYNYLIRRFRVQGILTKAEEVFVILLIKRIGSLNQNLFV